MILILGIMGTIVAVAISVWVVCIAMRKDKGADYDDLKSRIETLDNK